MPGNPRPLHQTLQEFSDVLLRHNLMQLDVDNPLEYELEALSILSRFNEAALHLVDRSSALLVASKIVKSSFGFWFEGVEVTRHAVDALANELLDTYVAAVSGDLTHVQNQANDEMLKSVEGA